MKIEIDRILIDLLAWVNRMGWYRAKEIKARPYEKVKAWRIAGAGVLHQVRRPPELCRRGVGAYIFSPFRYGKAVVKDVHICCDHLEGMARPAEGHKRDRCNAKRLTHRITVLAAEHHPKPNGLYQTEVIFMHDDDLQGFSTRRDVHIPCILHQLAMATAASVGSADPVDYLAQLDSAKRHCMGQEYTQTIKRPPGKPVIIYPYKPDQDGTIRGVRVQL